MRALLSAFLVIAALLGPVRAQPAPSDRAAIEAVIAAQIEAFRRDDAPAAFAFAAPGIQAMFGTPERFMGMVRGAYAPVYRPRQVEFAGIEPQDGGWVQAVELVGPDGEAQRALYTMQRGPDGAWRIAGCVLVRSERLSTSLTGRRAA